MANSEAFAPSIRSQQTHSQCNTTMDNLSMCPEAELAMQNDGLLSPQVPAFGPRFRDGRIHLR
jgi:hypothetical protein